MAIPGWKSLIVCDPAGGKDPLTQQTLPNCDWNALINLVMVLINDMVIVSTVVAVGVFAYAGIILLSAGGDVGARKRATGMFTKVVIGYVWILAAWVIVYTITKVLLAPGFTLLGSPR